MAYVPTGKPRGRRPGVPAKVSQQGRSPEQNTRFVLGSKQRDPLALTQRQKAFADALLDGKAPTTAARIAGYTTPHAVSSELTKGPRLLAYIAAQQNKLEQKALMTRKRVLDGFLEAIDQAKIMAEPMAQIAGWREIARMCGYFAPETKNINVNINQTRIMGQLEAMSDHELLQLAEKQADIIDAEAETETEEAGFAPQQAATSG